MFEEVPLRGFYRLRPMTFWEQALRALRRRYDRRDACPNCGACLNPHESGVCRSCAYQPQTTDPGRVEKS